MYPEAALATLGRLCADTRRSTNAHDDPGYAATLLHALQHAFPSQGQMLIDAAHASEPGLGRWLARAWAGLDEAMQEQLCGELHLPEFSVCLLDLQVGYCRTVLRTTEKDASAQAQAWGNLALALSAQGEATAQQEGLACASKSLKIHQQL